MHGKQELHNELDKISNWPNIYGKCMNNVSKCATFSKCSQQHVVGYTLIVLYAYVAT